MKNLKKSDMYFKRKEASGNSYTHLWDISTVRVYDGGFGLDKSNLPTDLNELPRGAILSVDLEERKARVIKTAELAETLTAESTKVKIGKGSLVDTGDTLGIGDKSVTVGALDTSNAGFDSFEIEANALGVAPIGTILSTFKDGKPVKAAGFNSRDVKLLGEDSVSVVYAVDKVESSRLPYPITESIIADLKQCLILKK